MSKRIKNLLKKAGTLLLTGIMCASAAIPALAAETDIINDTMKGGLTVHKYDLTAATNAGVDVNVFTANGEKDLAAEAALANYAVEGVEFTYLKISDIITYSEAGDIRVIYGIPSELETALALNQADAVKEEGGTYYYAMQELNDAIADMLVDNTNAKNTLEGYVKANGGTAMPLTNASGTSTVSNLDLGLYLVAETKVPENVFSTCDPFFVSVPSTDATGDYWFYNIDVYPKNQTSNPTLDKKVRSDETTAIYEDTATASGGETVEYILVSKLPKITSKASYLTVYTFTDVLSKGIDYNQDTRIYFYTNRDDAYQNNTANAVDTWVTGGSAPKFTTQYTGSATSAAGSSMVVTMTADGLADLNPARTEQYMVVAYTADIVSDANLVLGDDGNPNDVKLEWRRTSTNYLDTIDDECVVYSYGYDLTKKFSNDTGDFSQVQFVLKNATDGHFLTATGTAGLYYINGKSDTEAGATKFTPDNSGKLIIRELEADDYVLTEIHTSAGFSLLKDDIDISITGTSKTIIPSEAEITGTPNYTNAADYYAASGSKVRKFVEVIQNNPASVKVDTKDTAMGTDGTSNNALVQISVLNSATPLLPKTGGAGLYAVTIIGILAFAAGMFFMIKSRKRNADAR